MCAGAQDRARVGVHNAVALFNGRALKGAQLQPQPPAVPRPEAKPNVRRGEAQDEAEAEEVRRDSICSIVEDELDVDAAAAAEGKGSAPADESDEGEQSDEGGESDEGESEGSDESAHRAEGTHVTADLAEGEPAAVDATPAVDAAAAVAAAATALPPADAEAEGESAVHASGAEPAAASGTTADVIVAEEASANAIGVAAEGSASAVGVAEEGSASAATPADAAAESGGGADVDVGEPSVDLKFEAGIGVVSAAQDSDDAAAEEEALCEAQEAALGGEAAGAAASAEEVWDNAAALVASLGAEAVNSFRWCIVDTQVLAPQCTLGLILAGAASGPSRPSRIRVWLFAGRAPRRAPAIERRDGVAGGDGRRGCVARAAHAQPVDQVRRRRGRSADDVARDGRRRAHRRVLVRGPDGRGRMGCPGQRVAAAARARAGRGLGSRRQRRRPSPSDAAEARGPVAGGRDQRGGNLPTALPLRL